MLSFLHLLRACSAAVHDDPMPSAIFNAPFCASVSASSNASSGASFNASLNASFSGFWISCASFSTLMFFGSAPSILSGAGIQERATIA